jgi:predicted nuclease of predicted toxin-antitoxin system
VNLLLDMGLAPRTAIFLRSRGHDAIHLREHGLQRLADSEILKKAVAEQRTLVTFDLDFSRLVALQGLATPSVILFRLEQFTTDALNLQLIALLDQHATALHSGVILLVEADRVRIRNLPIR